MASLDPTLVTVAIAALAAAVGTIVTAWAGAAERKAAAAERLVAATERRALLEQTIAVKEETARQTVKIDAAAKDTAVVLGHVNSEKSIDQGKLNTVTRENELLREMLLERKATAALLAQSVATSGGVAPTNEVVLEQISANAEETAAGVRDLKSHE